LGIVALIFYLTGAIGVSLFGVCGFKISVFSIFIETVLILIYLMIVIISLLYFRKYIPKVSGGGERLAFVHPLLLPLHHNNINQCDCALREQPYCSYQLFEHQATLRLANIHHSLQLLNLITPAIVFVVIMMHPEVKNSFRRLLIRLFGENKRKIDEDSVDDTGRMIEMACKNDLLYKIMEQKKSSLVYTILSAIYVED
jgi:hypothetical protein